MCCACEAMWQHPDLHSSSCEDPTTVPSTTTTYTVKCVCVVKPTHEQRWAGRGGMGRSSCCCCREQAGQLRLCAAAGDTANAHTHRVAYIHTAGPLAVAPFASAGDSLKWVRVREHYTPGRPPLDCRGAKKFNLLIRGVCTIA